jgi:hypothetical protein
MAKAFWLLLWPDPHAYSHAQLVILFGQPQSLCLNQQLDTLHELWIRKSSGTVIVGMSCFVIAVETDGSFLVG